MRILVITNMYPPHHLGGYELACRDAVARWRSHGHHVEVLTSDIRFDHTGAEPDTEPGIHRRLKIYWRDGVIVSPAPPERIKVERRNAAALQEALASARPDVVSLWHMGAVSLSLITQVANRRIPIVSVVYDDWLVYGPVVDAWTRVFGPRKVLRPIAEALVGVPTTVDFGEASALCFMSGWLRERAETRSTLTLPDRRTIVYGGIDTSVFTAPEGAADQPWRGRLVVAGRIEARKGVHVAVDALAALDAGTTLRIVGPPDDHDYVTGLRERAGELRVADRIEWTGPLSRPDLATALAEADAFVFPVVWDEPFGMAPLEAMACGTPVIATGTGGSGEFLHDADGPDGNCIRVPTEDPGAIAGAVRRLAADAGLRRRLIEAGLATAARFADTRYYDELEGWHTAAAAGFSPPS